MHQGNPFPPRHRLDGHDPDGRAPIRIPVNGPESAVRAELANLKPGAHPGKDHAAKPGPGGGKEVGQAEPRPAALPPQELLAAIPATAESQAQAEEIAALREQVKRMAADFENFKRRRQEEDERSRLLAAERIVTALLPLLDNLERAVEASQDRSPPDPLAEGLALILRQMKEILASEGLEEIPSTGQPFDPALHNAVQRKETKKHPDGTVLETLQKGYALRHKVIRPALVMVAHHP